MPCECIILGHDTNGYYDVGIWYSTSYVLPSNYITIWSPQCSATDLMISPCVCLVNMCLCPTASCCISTVSVIEQCCICTKGIGAPQTNVMMR